MIYQPYLGQHSSWHMLWLYNVSHVSQESVNVKPISVLDENSKLLISKKKILRFVITISNDGRLIRPKFKEVLDHHDLSHSYHDQLLRSHAEDTYIGHSDRRRRAAALPTSQPYRVKSSTSLSLLHGHATLVAFNPSQSSAPAIFLV